MRGRTAGNEIDVVPSVSGLTDAAESLMNRKVWLPKVLYEAIPYFYFFSGIVAFLATVYVSSWFWVLPHYVLFSVACLHLGVAIFRRRRRARREDSASSSSA